MKIRLLMLLLVSILVTFSESFAQNVGIGDGAEFTPDASSIMELRTTTKGFLMPRVTRDQREAIVSPAHGLMVIQTDDHPGDGDPAGIWYYCNVPSVCNEWRNIVNMSNTVLFSNILTGTNNQAQMIVDNGATIELGTAGAVIESNKFLLNTNITSTDAVDLGTNEVAGTLPVTGGGTGTNVVPPAGSIIYSNGTSYTYVTNGTDGQVLSFNGTNAEWKNPLLPALPPGQIWVGDVNGDAQAVSVTGDLTISNTGDITITGLDGYPIGTGPAADNQILVYDDVSDTWVYTTLNNGTVSSVGLSLPSEFTVTVTPITTSGDLTATWASQLQNLVFASPNGASGVPSFRSIVAGDITSVNASSLVGTVAVTNGGTGTSTAPTANSIIIGNPTGTGYTSTVGTLGQVLSYDINGNPVWITAGTVSSVGLTLPSNVFDVANSPITGAGTLNVTFDSQLQNLVFASPDGSAGIPSFRKIESGDISSINANTITSGVLGVNYGGTGLNAAPAAGSILYSNGTSYVATSGTSGQVLTVNGSGVPTWTNPSSGGTVTSVGLALPTEFTISGSPVVAAGTLTGSWASQNQNLVFASPNGATGTPSFRSIVAGDISSVNASTLVGVVSTTNGGTGTSVAPTANGVIIANATGTGYTSTAAGTTGQVLVGNTGSGPVWSSLTSLAWGLTGNTGTDDAINYFGTNDAQDLVVKTNNTEYLRIKGDGTNNGFVGIGTNNPNTKLDIFNGHLSLTNNDDNARQSIFYERSGHGGSNFSSFRADTQAANINYILPPSQTVKDYTRQPGIGILANTPSGTTGQLGWIDAQSFGGSFVNVYVTPANQNYTATVDDFLIVISTTGRTVTLPLAANFRGKVYYIVLSINDNSTEGFISCSGLTDKISTKIESTSIKLEYGNGSGVYSGVLLVSDGISKWYVISSRRTD